VNETNKVDGAWLKAWRTRNTYSQAQLAEELNVTRQSIMKWEKSERLDRVVQLALQALERDPGLQKILVR
jgi:transcriptional regulator with XRE-family HTH domain